MSLGYSVFKTYLSICSERRFSERARKQKDPFQESEKDMLNATAITFIVIYVLEAFFTIIGNTFAIFVFWTQNFHQKRSCVLLINLAVADLLVGIAEPIVLSTAKVSKMAAVRTEENNTINPASALQILASRATVFFLALISLERVYAVLWPLRHRVTNTRVYICIIVIVWVVELCTAGLTSLLSMIDAKMARTYFTFSRRICVFTSLFVICGSYLKIRNRMRSSPSEIVPHSSRSTEYSLRLSKTVFMVIALSLVFWLPAFVVYAVQELCPNFFSQPELWFTNVLLLANSMINPFVYTFRMPIFKDALKKFWRRRQQNVGVRGVQESRL